MKKGSNMVLSLVIALTMMLGAVPGVIAADAEVECDSCYEMLTGTDIIYNDLGEAMCIYCEGILSQEILKVLLPEGENEYEEETQEECPACGALIALEEVELDEEGGLICPYCTEEEDSHESDNPEDYTDTGDEGAFSEIQLNASEWAKAEADEAYAKNLIPYEMLGVVLSTNVTREQFAAIAVKLYERVTAAAADNTLEGLPFTDCSPSGSYTPYVAAAYKLGITNGTSDTTFAPAQVITREQLATMLYRVVAKAQAEGASVKAVQTAEAVFSDDAAISGYAKESVYYMAQRGIIKGMDETTFAPQEVATKEQAIIISNRIASTLY